MRALLGHDILPERGAGGNEEKGASKQRATLLS